ncbi:MG2 domain-containing protein [Pseudoalteromonas luteoviolacea]|uniref:alpha-2-macroglobulin family protein n=1 Tax=Pseudoalteromonas luteoviolacea TaxID=43657 RepID=UPI001EEE5F84|nr:MG2 domain-containing protein [Pseudoalteromonas luteoviolacea]MCF6440020.1 MG2 domain-containing protein [Pseudoalteromonas luteoviolacea]
MNARSVYTSWLIISLLFVTIGWHHAAVAESKKRQTPQIAIVGSGPLVPKSSTQAIPISYKNTREVDIEILHITSAHDFLQRHYLNDKIYPSSLDRLSYSYESVFADRYTLPAGQEDKIHSAKLPVPKNLPSGWYIVTLKAAGQFGDLQAKHMLLTELGIQARVQKHHATFSVNYLQNGRSAKGAKVSIYRKHELIRQGTTNAQGNIDFTVTLEQNDIVIAELEQEDSPPHLAILPLKEVPLDLSAYQLGGRLYQETEAYIYSNRDLVRPGDSLPINILLRDFDGNKTSIEALTLSVKNSRQEQILTETLQAQEAGFFSKSLKTANDWPTGRYTVGVKLDPSARNFIAEMTFQLEEFVPERMDLKVTEQAPFVFAGQENTLTLNGKYLFGSPAAGNTFKTDVSHQPVRHFTGPYKAFVVGQDFYLSGRYKSLENKQLSEQGEAQVKISTPRAGQIKSPIKTQVFIALQEAGGAAVQRTSTFTSWRKSTIPGIKPLSKNVKYSSDAGFEIALLSADGQTLSTGSVKLELYYDQGNYYWMYEEGIGWQRKKQDRWRQEQQSVIDLNADIARIELPVKWGNYRLEATDLNTGSKTHYEFYAGWYRGYGQYAVKPEHLQLTLNKKAYNTGEQAALTLTSPISGELMVTLESHKVIWSQKLAVKKGQNQVVIPLNKLPSRHDLYVTATVFGQQQGAPKRYLGVIPLPLERSARQIQLKIDLPDHVEPLQTLQIPVTAEGLTDQGSTWVTVSMVDKGIINLSRFRPENPFDYFFAQRRYSGDIIDLYSRQYDPRPNPFAQSRFGSDSIENNTNRNDDLVESKTIQLMSRPVRLEQGKALVELTLPDYNGQAQLIVTAFNDSQVGQLVQDQIIRMPLVAELSVPRFLVPGDASSVTLDIHNLSGQAQTFDVTLSVDNHVTIAEQTTYTETLGEGQHWSKTAAIHTQANNPDGIATFTLRVTGGNLDVTRSWRVPVGYIEPWVTLAKNTQLQPNETLTADISNWGGLKVIGGKEGKLLISHTPILNIAQFASGLHSYPYGCAEQTTSKAWPFILQNSQLDKFQQSALQQSSKLTSSKDYLSAAVSRLKTMQKATGGFGTWGSYSQESPWLSVYVTDFLTQVSTQYPEIVPKDMLQEAQYRVLRYARGDFVNTLTSQPEAAIAATTYAAYLSSSLGKLSYSDIEALQISTFPSQLSLIQFAAALANTGAIAQASALLNQFDAQTRADDYIYDYGSQVRDDAMAIIALNQMAQLRGIQSKARRIANTLATSLPALAINKQWLSTQEQAALLRSAIAIDEQNQQPLSVVINGNTIEHQGLLTHPLTAGLVLENTTNSPLHVQQLHTGYLDFNPAIANQINPFNTVKMKHFLRRWFTLEGKPIDEQVSLKVGDRVLVVLDVESKERIHDAMIVDRIPAGFVLENPALLQDLDIQKLLPEGVVLSQIEHQEYRHDRYVAVTDLKPRQQYHRYSDDRPRQQFAYLLRAEVPGTYANPPSFMESMYRPQKHVLYSQFPSTLTIER